MNTTSNSTANMYLYYSKVWLDVLQPRLCLYQFAEKTKLPLNTGKQVKWLRYNRVNGTTTPLTEGVTPSETQITAQNVTATAQQYGEYSKVSDFFEMTAIDPVLKNHAELLGEAASQVVEDLIVAELDASGSIQRVNDRATDNDILATDVLVMKELIEAKLTLKKNLVPAHKIGKYIAVISPSSEYDLQVEKNTGGWLDINQFALRDKEKISVGELGEAYGLKFFASDRMTSAANSSSIPVYKNYVMGSRPFGVVELNAKNVQMIIKNSDSGGVSNPLELFSTVGYKIPGFVAKYLGGSSNGTAERLIQVRAASALA